VLNSPEIPCKNIGISLIIVARLSEICQYFYRESRDYSARQLCKNKLRRPWRSEAAEAWRPELDAERGGAVETGAGRGAAEAWSAELGASEAHSAEASANAARNAEHRRATAQGGTASISEASTQGGTPSIREGGAL
jgi:hypothetical protein